MHCLSTEWNRRTLQKAQAICIVPVGEGNLAGTSRRVRIVMAGTGRAAFRIYEDGYDVAKEIADTRTFEWPEVDSPSDRIELTLAPNQTLWAIVSQANAATPGLLHCSVIVHYYAPRHAASQEAP